MNRLYWALVSVSTAVMFAVGEQIGKRLEPYAFDNAEPATPDPEPDRVAAEHFVLWDRELWS